MFVRRKPLFLNFLRLELPAEMHTKTQVILDNPSFHFLEDSVINDS